MSCYIMLKSLLFLVHSKSQPCFNELIKANVYKGFYQKKWTFIWLTLDARSTYISWHLSNLFTFYTKQLCLNLLGVVWTSKQILLHNDFVWLYIEQQQSILKTICSCWPHTVILLQQGSKVKWTKRSWS